MSYTKHPTNNYFTFLVVDVQHFNPRSGFTHTNFDLRILMWIFSILMKCLPPY